MNRSTAREIAVHFAFELAFSDERVQQLLERELTAESFAARAKDEPLYAGENKAVPQNKEPASSQPNIPKKSKQKLPKPQKEKRVCSLSAVVICIIIILILSVVCGVLGGLYLGERTKVRKMRQGSIIAPYSYSDFYNDK